MKKIKWLSDPSVEEIIRSEGLSYVVKRDIPLAKINKTESLQNHARPDAELDNSVVEDYANKMKQGEPFPMLVTLPSRQAKDMLIFAGGNHRSAGMELAGITHFDSYQVQFHKDLEEAAYDALPRILNRSGGKALEVEAAMSNAIADVFRGMPKKDAARRHRVSLDALFKRIQNEEVIVAMEKQGFNPPRSKRTKTGLAPLATLQNESVKAAAANLVLTYGLTGDSVSLLIEKLRKATSESSQLAIVEDWDSDMRPVRSIKKLVKPGKSIRCNTAASAPERNAFISWLNTGIMRFGTKTDLTEFQIVDELDQKKTAGKMETLIRKARIMVENYKLKSRR